jgi:hypothetical protein
MQPILKAKSFSKEHTISIFRTKDRDSVFRRSFGVYLQIYAASQRTTSPVEHNTTEQLSVIQKSV